MTIYITNKEYFEWEIPDKLSQLIDSGEKSVQDIIDKHFDTDLESVIKISDDYYEFANT